MKNYFADNNYGIRFKSKTEAIEQLCLKVFGAIPVYESSLEELKEETLESMYAKVVAVALECDPIPANDRADDKLEPPWEVFVRVKRERDKLVSALWSIREYWNRNQNESAMVDACWHAIYTAEQALAVVKEGSNE
jgi:hypothetical protein